MRPTPGEDAAIVAEVRRLSDLDSLRDAAEMRRSRSPGSMSWTGPRRRVGALDLLGEARARIESSDDPALAALGPRLAEAIAMVVDVAAELTSYLGGLPADPGALDSLLTAAGRTQDTHPQVRRRRRRRHSPGPTTPGPGSQRIDVSEDALAALRTRSRRPQRTVAAAARS